VSDSNVTFIGNLVADGELRFVGADGKPVYNNRIAVNKSKKVGDEWVNESSFFNISVWDSLGENFASLPKGTRVIVVGDLFVREYEKDGEKRQSLDVTVVAGGPDLKWATAEVTRTQADGAKGGAKKGTSKRAADPVYGDEEPF